MRTVLFGFAVASLRGPVQFPFPELAKEEAEPPSAPEEAPVAEVHVEAPTADSGVAPWSMPTLAPDSVAASADAFKHPTAAMVKDWETPPKVELFVPDSPTEAPKQVMAKRPAPVVQSKIQPVDPYAKRDDNAELAAIQQESPEAYGIVKALLMKKQLGLPLPGADAEKSESGEASDSSESAPSSSNLNMWNWKPRASPSDDLAVVEEVSSKHTAEPPKEVAEEAPVEQAEAQAEAPVQQVSMPEPAAPETTQPEPEPASQGMSLEAASTQSHESMSLGSLGSWLGQSQGKVATPTAAAPAGSAMLSKYAADLA